MQATQHTLPHRLTLTHAHRPLPHPTTHLDLVKGLADARQLDEDVVGAAVLHQAHLVLLGAAPLDGLGLHDLCVCGCVGGVGGQGSREKKRSETRAGAARRNKRVKTGQRGQHDGGQIRAARRVWKCVHALCQPTPAGPRRFNDSQPRQVGSSRRPRPTWNSDSSWRRSRCSLSRLARLHTVPSRACFSLSQCSCFRRRRCASLACSSSRELPRRAAEVGDRGTTQPGCRPAFASAFSARFLPRVPGGGGGGGGGGPALKQHTAWKRVAIRDAGRKQGRMGPVHGRGAGTPWCCPLAAYLLACRRASSAAAALPWCRPWVAAEVVGAGLRPWRRLWAALEAAAAEGHPWLPALAAAGVAGEALRRPWPLAWVAAVAGVAVPQPSWQRSSREAAWEAAEEEAGLLQLPAWPACWPSSREAAWEAAEEGAGPRHPLASPACSPSSRGAAAAAAVAAARRCPAVAWLPAGGSRAAGSAASPPGEAPAWHPDPSSTSWHAPPSAQPGPGACTRRRHPAAPPPSATLQARDGQSRCHTPTHPPQRQPRSTLPAAGACMQRQEKTSGPPTKPTAAWLQARLQAMASGHGRTRAGGHGRGQHLLQVFRRSQQLLQ